MVPEVAKPTIGDPGARRRRDAGISASAAIAGHPITRAVVRRLLLAVPLLLLVSVLTFVLISLTPGDAARGIIGTEGSPEDYERLRQALGLDQPLYEQYWSWLSGAVHGDFGVSLINDESVAEAIRARLPVTLSLMFGSLLISLVVGVAIGVFSAVRGGFAGRMLDAFVLIGLAVPAFWLGLELIVIFAVKLGWLPSIGYVPVNESVGGWLESLTLPVTALAVGCVASIAKHTRASMLQVLGSEYIRMAWANGLRPRSVLYRHALRNASLPVVTILGLEAVALAGGAVVIETVFALPGLGSLTVEAAHAHDLPMVQGLAVCFTLVVVVINLAVDLLYTWLNPRVTVG